MMSSTSWTFVVGVRRSAVMLRTKVRWQVDDLLVQLVVCVEFPCVLVHGIRGLVQRVQVWA